MSHSLWALTLVKLIKFFCINMSITSPFTSSFVNNLQFRINRLDLVRLALYLVNWPTIVLRCFDAVDWVIWPIKSPRHDLRRAKLPHCSTSRLEFPSCLPSFNFHQSRTIQRWVENPSLQPSLQHTLRTFYFKSVLYLLTYLLNYCNVFGGMLNPNQPTLMQIPKSLIPRPRPKHRYVPQSALSTWWGCGLVAAAAAADRF